MDGDGMVAVVRGTKGADLSVTLLPNAYLRRDTQKFNTNNDSICARVTQSNAQTNTERIPQNIRRFNVNYQFSNYYKPSVNYVLPFPHQTTKRNMKNLRAHPKLKKQQTYKRNQNEYNKINNTNRKVNYNINSSVNRSLSSVLATSSSFTLYPAHIGAGKENLVSKHSVIRSYFVLLEKGNKSNSYPSGSQTYNPCPMKGQKELTKYMYDYLKNETLVPKVDVRYFTEIKKALKNGLRRITDKNIPCPVKSSRFYKHKRFGNCSKHSLTDSVSHETKVLKRSVSSNIFKSKCFCHEPLTCECDTTKKTVTNGYISPMYLDESHKKRYPKSQLKQNMFDVSAPGDFTDSKDQKIFDVISKWVKDIPKDPNFNEIDKAKQAVLVEKLAGTLKEIFNTEDFAIRARPEIVKCLNNLPMLRLDDATDQARFIEELNNDLIRRFEGLAESDFVDCISSEITKIAAENNINVDNIQSQINDFVDELIPIARKRPKNKESYKEMLKTKLIELFKNYNLVDDLKDNDKINVLGEKLADRLCHIYLYNFSDESEINQDNIDEKTILDWLKGIPEISNINKNQCLKIIKPLINKYSSCKQRDYKNIETEKRVEDDIKTCLDLMENKLDISFSIRRKGELINQLKRLLFGTEKTVKDENDTSLGTVMEWLLTIPGLSEQNIMENEEEIKKYDRLMKEVRTHMNNKLPNVKKVISNWFQNFLRKNNIRLDPKVYDNLINKLINKVNDVSNPASVVIKPRKRWNDKENRSKYSNIENIVDVCFSDFGVNAKEVTKRKIVEEILSNIADNNILGDKVLNNLMSIMSKDTSLEQNTIKKLYNEIIHRVNQKNNQQDDLSQIFQNKTSENDTFDIAESKARRYFLGPNEQENLSFDDNFTTSTPIRCSQKDMSTNNKLSNSQYLNDGRSAIYNWLNLFDISSLENNNLTEIILSDYLERQKYLQLSGIKTKENDEIEQLKYQIYRQMYKFTNSEMLQVVMAKVTDLYKNLKYLKHYKTLEEEQISDVKLKTLSSEDFNNLTQKIRLWLNSMSSQLTPSDKNYRENMIQDLSKSLYLLKKEGNYKTHGKNIITNWLQKLLNVSDINELNDLSENLLTYFENDSLRDTQIPIQDISEFLIENLKGAILDWLREIRPFPRNMMLNIPLLEDFASLLANDLKRVFEKNSNIWSNEFENSLTEEIVKNFKNILSHDEKDSTFYQKLAKNLLTYMKQQRIFHSISERLIMDTMHGKDLINKRKYGNKIKEAIFLWSKNLALETGKSYEDIEELIRDFVETLFTYIRKDISSIENRLKQDALKLLKNIPLKIHQERNSVLQNYIKSLINTIEGNIDLNDAVKLDKKRNYKIDSHLRNKDEDIYDCIKNWCDILPFHVEDSADSKEKDKKIRQNLATQIIRFIHNFNSNDDVSKKDAYKLLHDHIKEQLKTLCTTPDLENCMDLLIDALIERLKDAKCLNVKESIGSIYNHLLYETINKTLSLIANPTGDDQISLDLLKEKLANAFIELHQPTDDVDILSKYKNKLYNVISKFCKDYLDQSLIVPRDREKVKEELDKALRDASIPKLNISKEILDKTDEMVVSHRHVATQSDLNVTPSVLSIEDIDLLNNIRSRSRYLARLNAHQDSKKIVHKDVSISPMPLDVNTQTDIQSNKNIADGITNTSNHSLNDRVCLQKEISPQVVIKEYYWDSSGSKQSLCMSILSKISEHIDHVPKNDLISSNQATKTTKPDVNRKKKETTYAQTNIPIKHIKNSSKQTSNTFERIIVPSTRRPHLEVNQEETENFVNDEDDNRIKIDPKSKRAVIPSDVVPSRLKLNLGDEDVSKMMSENREMENYQDMWKFNKLGQNCNCKDYIFSKCRNRMHICGRQSNLKHCAKGFGCFCPYPNNLFFKKEC